ncbi:MAG: hypothetical protein RL092_496, partial [Bacteroidota bacterium]
MRYFTLVLFSFVLTATNAQVDLPVGFTSSELEQIARGDFQISSSQTRGIATPPPFTNLRSMAEWEEIQ